jgi:pimeloyl-ACP methyl ester carboxylesterase
VSCRLLRPPRRETLRLRGLDIAVTRWGPEPGPGEAPIVLLHGFMDSGATFQFMIDALPQDWSLLAIDWRGFGGSQWPNEGYWFPDYLADLDALLTRLTPASPARVIGHSMGGNVAMLYAGVRPERVRCLLNLEGFGLPRTQPQQAPQRLDRWLRQVAQSVETKRYDSLAQLASAIAKRYPTLSLDRVDFLAQAWSRPNSQGGIELAADPRHRWVNPVLYRREEAEACWRQIRAAVLLLLGENSEIRAARTDDQLDAAYRSSIPQLEIGEIKNAGHMMHIEQPQQVAEFAQQFFSRFG